MDIVERSSLMLFPRLAPGDTPSTSPLADLSPFAWPSYRRITLAEGGDAGASFSITGDVADEASMEYWLENWLAAHFMEEYGGETCFLGRIHTMRLTYNGIFLVYSLDSCWNKIACRYTSVVDGQQYLSSWYEDTASQAVWGVRELILEPEDIIGGSEAAALAQDALAELAQPRVWRGDVDFAATAKAVLKVEVEGYPATLDVKHHNDTSTATQDADAAVTAVLATADYVSAGSIATNGTQVTRKSDYRPGLQRLKYVASRRDSSGDRYNFGCVGSLAFDYAAANVSAVRYYLQMKRKRPLIFDANQNYVPAPLVRPGGVSFVTDTMPGRAVESTLLDDIRAQFDEAVEYSAAGAKLRGQWDLNSRVAALNMALIARRNR